MDVCRKEMPAVTHLETDHWVRCHLVGAASNDTTPPDCTAVSTLEEGEPADPAQLP